MGIARGESAPAADAQRKLDDSVQGGRGASPQRRQSPRKRSDAGIARGESTQAGDAPRTMLRRATEAAGASPQRGDTTPEEKRQIPNAVLLASYIEIILCPIASPPLGPQNTLRIRSSNLTEQMMAKISGSIFLYAAVAVLLAGCQRQEAPSALSKEEPRQTVIADVTSVPQLPTRDPSLPDAATVLAAEDTAEKAKPTQEAELQQKPAAQVDMTKAEEAKAMPPSSQANDQSTTTLDKKGTAESASR